MAKNTAENPDVIIDVTETYSKTEKFINENKNTIIGIGVGVVALVAGYVGYNQFILAPLEKEAKEQVWKAQEYFEMDSFRLAIAGDGNYYGFETIVDDYGSTKTGKLAKYYLGISYLRIGEYEMAIDELSGFSSSDIMLSAVATGAIGDAYSELGDLESAVSYYEKAANKNSNNFTSPIYLMKAGLAHEMLGNNEKALAAFKKIKTDFNSTQEARTIDKYIARAEGRISASK